jgi:isopropylmalate/homocitrate/citramalate synthase
VDLPARVDVDEVFPRDGLQRLDRFVPTERTAALVDDLVATGLRSVVVTALSRPEAVPTLRDAGDLFERLARRAGVTYHALVPNRAGAERAVAAGVDAVSLSATAGMADPRGVDDLRARADERPGLDAVDAGLHLDDTNGLALAGGTPAALLRATGGVADE